jgi:hypothetical protein
MEAYRAPSPWEAILSNIGHRLVARCLALFREVPPFRRKRYGTSISAHHSSPGPNDGVGQIWRRRKDGNPGDVIWKRPNLACAGPARCRHFLTSLADGAQRALASRKGAPLVSFQFHKAVVQRGVVAHLNFQLSFKEGKAQPEFFGCVKGRFRPPHLRGRVLPHRVAPKQTKLLLPAFQYRR